MAAVVLACVTLVVTWILTGQVRKYALRHAVLDHPNQRSSHRTPIPTGGGVAIAAALLAAIVVAGSTGMAPRPVAIALLGGLPVALIGWIDDRRGLGALPRLTVQVAAACWAIAWLGGFPAIRLGLDRFDLGFAGPLVGVFGIVWAINCFNFMDGIDGLAGGEAVVVGGAGAVILALIGDPGLALLSALIAAASAGFLAWNWHPARIFMGDAGSGFLGLSVRRPSPPLRKTRVPCLSLAGSRFSGSSCSTPPRRSCFGCGEGNGGSRPTETTPISGRSSADTATGR